MYFWKSNQIVIFTLIASFFAFGCATPQERAQKNAVDVRMICDHFGEPGYLRRFPDSTWENGGVSMIAVQSRTGQRMDISADSIPDTTTIADQVQLDYFLAQYHSLCSGKFPKAYDSIPYVVELKRKESEEAELRRKAQEERRLELERQRREESRLAELQRLREQEAARKAAEDRDRAEQEAARVATEENERKKAEELKRLSTVTLARRQMIASTPVLTGAFRISGLLNEIAANRFTRPAYADRLQNQATAEAKSLFQVGNQLEFISWCAVSRDAMPGDLKSPCFPGILQYSSLLHGSDQTSQTLLEQIELIPYGKVFDVRLQLTQVCFLGCSTSVWATGGGIRLYVKVISIGNSRDAPPEWSGTSE